MTSTHHSILIVGGGTAGLTVAVRLRRARAELSIGVIEPSSRHYYQPLWTLVGGGVVKKESTVRDESDVMPHGVEWLRGAAMEFRPKLKTVITAEGRLHTYEQMVVCPGLQLDWSAVPGLRESIGRNGVCSNYSYDTVDSPWEALSGFRGGTALFTMPNTAVKCGGAPQKIMYLAEDWIRRQGVREQSRVVYVTPGAALFGVAKYRAALERIAAARGIETRLRHHLVEVRGGERVAVLENLDTRARDPVRFDLLHVTPPMSAPDFIKTSPLADPSGWVEADPYTLQHPRFPDIFALGDASSLPTSKTGAAIRKQAPVLVANLLSLRSGRPLAARYDGYTSCPIVTRRGRMLLAEFDYDGNPCESFPFN